jgi:hypothetical protein
MNLMVILREAGVVSPLRRVLEIPRWDERLSRLQKYAPRAVRYACKYRVVSM